MRPAPGLEEEEQGPDAAVQRLQVAQQLRVAQAERVDGRQVAVDAGVHELGHGDARLVA